MYKQWTGNKNVDWCVEITRRSNVSINSKERARIYYVCRKRSVSIAERYSFDWTQTTYYMKSMVCDVLGSMIKHEIHGDFRSFLHQQHKWPLYTKSRWRKIKTAQYLGVLFSFLLYNFFAIPISLAVLCRKWRRNVDVRSFAFAPHTFLPLRQFFLLSDIYSQDNDTYVCSYDWSWYEIAMPAWASLRCKSCVCENSGQWCAVCEH